jgi:protein-disulfide isomerase
MEEDKKNEMEETKNAEISLSENGENELNDKNVSAPDENKKVKNLISAIILLSGLFLGSLFVDIAQLVKGEGYSRKNLAKSDVFAADGKTWVAYDEPVVKLKVLSDEKCEECDPGEVLVWLRRVMPTVSAEKVEFDSTEGKKMIEDFKVKTLPAFVFSEELKKTELYAQAEEAFVAEGANYFLNSQALGIPAGKYLELPGIEEGDAVFGKKDSQVRIIVFSDFQCPYSNLFFETLKNKIKDYQDKAAFVFKEFPLTSIHPKAEEASLAAKCALEQEKYLEYTGELFSKQSEWGEAKDNSIFKKYAQKLGLDTQKFNACLDEKKYQAKIEADKKLAEEFGVTGTPTIFVGGQSKSGALTEDQLKEILDKELESQKK